MKMPDLPVASPKTLRILGTRGVPAAHGGFETFAEQLALYLAARGWRVIVYCQEDGGGQVHEDIWRGVERVHIPVRTAGAAGTIVFDWLATRHAARYRDLCLTLGYNTAVFCAWLRLKGVPNVINMDGIEWRRQKWGVAAKAWFWFNDWAGCMLGDHLVADNPGIQHHLRTRVAESKITTIPYGADHVTSMSIDALQPLQLEPGRYWTLIARPEPENSVLEIVRAFSRRRRGTQLAVLGRYDVERNPYHAAVRAAASPEVRFVGAIYDQAIVKALRFHALGYLHGHQVGGTNPSLVEALGAGNPVIAHDNAFNRWVAGPGNLYFSSEEDCASALDRLEGQPEELASMRKASSERFLSALTWPQVLATYEALLDAWLPAGARRHQLS
jgi:glycosyltransferase involved in cell wall biosynthesis